MEVLKEALYEEMSAADGPKRLHLEREITR
jgi:hypothetical protein